MLPLDYALRNLLRQPGRCLQLILGSALVVVLVSAAESFGTGMQESLGATGDPANVIILGAGSEESVERSEVDLQVEGIIAASIAGLAEEQGRPAVSGEVVFNTFVHVDDERVPAILRGVTPAALAVHRRLRLVEGHFPGPDEILVGAQAHRVLGVAPERLAVGQTLHFEGHDYRISGRAIAPGTVLESECWIDRSDLMAATGRDGISCVIARLDSATPSDIELFAAMRQDLEIVAIDAATYYQQLGDFLQPIAWMAWATALLIALGAVFGGLNTLYAAFAARAAELASLQAIGFRRLAIAWSLLQESLIATLTGTALGLIAAVLLLDGITVVFSIGVFALLVTPSTLLLGLATGSALGIIGCIPPAWRCLAPPLPVVLRSS